MTKAPYNEHQLQKSIVMHLRGLGYITHGDQSGQYQPSIMQRSKSKATGQLSGFPDLTIFLDLGRCLFLELKTKTGVLSPSQKALHAALRQGGHMVYIIKAETPIEALNQLEAILKQIPHKILRYQNLGDPIGW